MLDEIARGGRAVGASTRRRLARTAFAATAAYDAAIVEWLDEEVGGAGGGTDEAPADGLPPSLTLRLERAQDLRYGENPHQQAARYRARRGDGLVGHGRRSTAARS